MAECNPSSNNPPLLVSELHLEHACIALIDPNDPSNTRLTNFWNVMVSNCEETNIPVTFTWAQFLAAAQSDC